MLHTNFHSRSFQHQLQFKHFSCDFGEIWTHISMSEHTYSKIMSIFFLLGYLTEGERTNWSVFSSF